MNGLESALGDLAEFLERARVPYMVIGGFANLYWGRPRLTEDLDLTVEVAESELANFLDQLGARYRLLAPSPREFARETRVIPIETPGGPRADLILAGLPYESAAIRRAVELPLGTRTIKVCAAEDLILHKLASERARDREDVEGVILRQGRALNLAYLDPLVGELGRALERPEIKSFYRACLEKAGVTP